LSCGEITDEKVIGGELRNLEERGERRNEVEKGWNLGFLEIK
jgi:hypothetical protein